MRIQHNIAAVNANRMLEANNNKVSKNLEKLSSGYKINRAGDDAAGLAISEKMRGQIRGLDQATNNASDGISLVQTAEGSLNETASILQRMKELATQSSNGTYQNNVDRENISKEVTSLTTEIDRIATSTNFNKINLLDGSLDQAGSAATGAVGGNSLTVTGLTSGTNVKFVTIAGTDGQTATDAGAVTAAWDATSKTMTVSLRYNSNATPVAVVYDAAKIQAAMNKATGTGAPTGITVKADGTDTFTTGTAANAAFASITAADATKATVSASADSAYKIDVTKAGATGVQTITFANTATALGASFDSTAGTQALSINLDSTKSYTAEDLTKMVKSAGVDGFSFDFKGEVKGDAIATGYGAAAIAVTDGTGTLGGKGLSFQIGANGSSDQQVSLNVGDMSSKGLKLSSLSVATQDDAKAAIATIDAAINQVSGTRADLGALQNRLEHTVSNLGVTSENLTSAESRIRDVDMAKEMMEMTKNNVLAQAAQSMLAQANTQPQNVLKLLQ